MISTFVKKQIRLLAALAVVTLAGPGAHAASGGRRVTIKPAVEIDLSKTEISLSDVVIAQGLSRTAIDAFRKIKLSDAPKAGESRIFTESVIADSIKPDLEAVEQATGESFELKIPSRVTVSKKKPSLDAGEIKQQLLSQFKSLCADCEFEIRNLSTPAVAKLADGATWTMRTRGEIPKGGFSYPIEVTKSDVVVQTLWVSGSLVVRRAVPVAAREIMIGERIQPDDLVTQLKDVTFNNDAPILASELSSGVAARQIAAGQIVFRSSLRRELAIKQGDIVKVRTGNDEWEISLDGVSQSSGYVGDSVNVKIPKTQKVVAGILKEKGVVEVQ